jgi:hypothetical protein
VSRTSTVFASVSFLRLHINALLLGGNTNNLTEDVPLHDTRPFDPGPLKSPSPTTVTNPQNPTNKDVNELHLAISSLTTGDVLRRLVQEWLSKGPVAELNENFGYFDFFMIQFPNKEHISRQFMGVVDTNPPCTVLCNETEVESNFVASIERLEWLNETLSGAQTVLMKPSHFWVSPNVEGDVLYVLSCSSVRTRTYYKLCFELDDWFFWSCGIMLLFCKLL